MSILSRIFIVLNLLLALSFGVMSLVLYAKKQNWVEENIKNVKKRNENFDKWQETEKKYEIAVAERDKTKADLSEKLASASSDRDRFRDQVSSLEVQNKNLQARISNIEVSLKRLEEQVKSEQDRNESLQGELAQARQESLNATQAMQFAQTQAIELAADLKESQNELTQIAKRNADLVNQLLQLNTAIQKLEGMGVDLNQIIAAEAPPVPIAGRILRVEEAVGLVIINVGEKDHVKNGMEFVISRGDEYIGKVRVRNTYPDMSSASVIPELTREVPEISDLAQTM